MKKFYKESDKMKPVLIFVYNADSGLFNSLADMAQVKNARRGCAISHAGTGSHVTCAIVEKP